MSRPPLQWWVRAGNRAYGPYPSERLPGFVREGRLTPETSVANDASGPWWPAGRNPSLEEVFAGALSQPPPPAQPPHPPGSSPAPAPGPTAQPVPSPAPAAHALLIFAELVDEREASVSAILQRLGAVARARPGVWLLRADADAAAIRNALSHALGEGESLIVVQACAGDAAWFNLGGEADRALRTLWAQPTGRSSRA